MENARTAASTTTLAVNGKSHALDSGALDPETPLLWVLRDELGLTGTKFGCGEGYCGACTVLEDGKAVRSCQVPLSAAAGHRYTTIEGLSPEAGKPAHPVQVAWLEERVPQCGYCQAGMMLEVAAFSNRAAKPSVAEVEAALDEHLCRCGTYPRIRTAARKALGIGRAGGAA
jgi:isoquinoline 1-oxidoreductase subunit alpha